MFIIFIISTLILTESCGPTPEQNSLKEQAVPTKKPSAKRPPPGMHSDKSTPSSQNCADILGKFEDPAANIVSSSDFNKRYELKINLRDASKSGAFPMIVYDHQDQRTEFLKIFPPILARLNKEQIRKNPSYLEIFQTCRLSNLSSNFNLPPHIKASIFFVNVYAIGFLKSMDPFGNFSEQTLNFYPYMATEAVNNITLTQLATEPQKVASPEELGFNLKNAPPMVLESILLQIIVALKNSYEIWGLVHNDLHPGNILLSKDQKANFYIEYKNKKLPLQGPLVKIIDFGLGESRNFKQEQSINFDVWIKNRPFIKELNIFINAARSNAIPATTQLRIGQISSNQDIRMFNLILRALKPLLISRGSTMPNNRYCADYNDCIEFLSQWWKNK